MIMGMQHEEEAEAANSGGAICDGVFGWDAKTISPPYATCIAPTKDLARVEEEGIVRRTRNHFQDGVAGTLPALDIKSMPRHIFSLAPALGGRCASTRDALVALQSIPYNGAPKIPAQEPQAFFPLTPAYPRLCSEFTVPTAVSLGEISPDPVAALTHPPLRVCVVNGSPRVPPPSRWAASAMPVPPHWRVHSGSAHINPLFSVTIAHINPGYHPVYTITRHDILLHECGLATPAAPTTGIDMCAGPAPTDSVYALVRASPNSDDPHANLGAFFGNAMPTGYGPGSAAPTVVSTLERQPVHVCDKPLNRAYHSDTPAVLFVAAAAFPSFPHPSGAPDVDTCIGSLVLPA
ncbi:hypothetical protein B0H13DRAFT_2313324 [Mycena leptocephala]|nr:hypothetical protein B0H13DRAFT_2313324 [Mycena leptocephala]